MEIQNRCDAGILDARAALMTLAAMTVSNHRLILKAVGILAILLCAGMDANAQSIPNPTPLAPPPKARPKGPGPTPDPAPGPRRSVAADPARYRACLELADSDPEKAYDTATAWVEEAQSTTANHCLAMALMKLGKFEESGILLTGMAASMPNAPKNVRAELLVQAGEVYLLAKQPDGALKVLEQARQLSPEDPGILADQGRAYLLGSKWARANEVLSQALSLEPTQAGFWSLRATARRQTKQIKAAEEDIETALALDENSPDIWLERGLIDIAKSDKPKARKNLLRAIQIDEKSPVAEQARAAIEAMDVKSRK